MGVTIKVNGVCNSLVHQGSNGVSIATLPDVCKTPTPGGPVPVPYPNVSRTATLTKGTKTVKVDGGNMAAIDGSEFSSSNGDEPGTLGGVKSSTFMKESTWLTYSFDVKMEGKGACRLQDKKLQNHGNTSDLAGELQIPVTGEVPEELDKIAKKCNEEINDDAGYPPKGKKKPSGKECTALGTKKHKCCEDALKDKYDNVKSEVGYKENGEMISQDVVAAAKDKAAVVYEAAKAAGGSTKGVYMKSLYAALGKHIRADVVVLKDSALPATKDNIKAVYDFKFNCKDDPKMSNAQKKRYWKILRKEPTLIHAW